MTAPNVTLQHLRRLRANPCSNSDSHVAPSYTPFGFGVRFPDKKSDQAKGVDRVVTSFAIDKAEITGGTARYISEMMTSRHVIFPFHTYALTHICDSSGVATPLKGLAGRPTPESLP